MSAETAVAIAMQLRAYAEIENFRGLAALVNDLNPAIVPEVIISLAALACRPAPVTPSGDPKP